jgi:hypothetical protein
MPRNPEFPVPNLFLVSLPQDNVETLRPHASAEDLEADPLRMQEMLELVRAYCAIKDTAVRQCFLSLVKACATASDVTARDTSCTD